jgi:glycosyltransferase involved in cell wall biosynthesis
MRILHLVHQYMPEKVGGTELYTQTIAQFQVAQGDEAAIFTPAVANGRFPQPELESGVRVYRVPVGARSATQVFGSSFGQKALARGLTAVLRQEQPDLVHIQHLMGLPASLVSQLNQAGIPYLVTLHDYWYICANGQLITNDRNEICEGPKWWINCGRCALARAGQPRLMPLAPAVAPVMAARHRLLQNVLRGARAIIAPTQFVDETYRQMGLAAEKVTIVPHGIEYPAIMPPRQREADGRLRILFVGSLAWQKGVHVLITAVNQLPPDAVELHIYGDLDTFPDYTAHLRQISQHPGIQFHGRIARADLWAELVNADVGVLPTLWYEVSPLTIQEMFAAGLPIAASRIGAMPEKIADGVAGLLFPPGDAAALRDVLARLLADGGLRARLRAGIGPVRTVAEHMGEVTAIYQQALTPRGET